MSRLGHIHLIKKGPHIDNKHNVDKGWNNYAEWKKKKRQKRELDEPIYIRFSKMQINIDGKRSSVCVEIQGRVEGRN